MVRTPVGHPHKERQAAGNEWRKAREEIVSGGGVTTGRSMSVGRVSSGSGAGSAVMSAGVVAAPGGLLGSILDRRAAQGR